MEIRSRSSRQKRGGSLNTQISVTPLVDVMLVLLIIFMVAAPMLTVGVPVNLPKTHAAKMNDQIEPIVVSIDINGQIFLQETALTPDGLIEKLQTLTQNNLEAKIYVRGDEKLPYGKIMDVMGLIAKSGYTKVSLIAQLPMGK